MEPFVGGQLERDKMYISPPFVRALYPKYDDILFVRLFYV